jgi:uncharacterized UBP type Zn finger protein
MCGHLEKVSRRRAPVLPRAAGCQECLAEGRSWVQLRLCLTCGHVGCCDSSPGRHATRHFLAKRHPVIKTFEPGARWAWCYVDEEMVASIPAFTVESPPQHYAAPTHAP